MSIAVDAALKIYLLLNCRHTKQDHEINLAAARFRGNTVFTYSSHLGYNHDHFTNKLTCCGLTITF